MAKFLFTTLVRERSLYTGPSGQMYTIYRGQPFEVTDKLDIAEFEKKTQFKKVTIANKVKDAVTKVVTKEPKADPTFEEELAELKLSRADIQKVVRLYGDMATFRTRIANYGVAKDLSKAGQDKVLAWLNGLEVSEDAKEDSEKKSE